MARLIRLRRYEHMSVQHALHRVRASQVHALCPGDSRLGGMLIDWVPTRCVTAAGHGPTFNVHLCSSGYVQLHLLSGDAQSDMAAGALRAKQGHGALTAVQQRLILWVRWLLADFVVLLLRAHFYCTESEVYWQEVFYYRCPAPDSSFLQSKLCPR